MVAGEPFYRDLFRFSGRRRRGSYFNCMATYTVLLFPIYVLLDYTRHLLAVQALLMFMLVLLTVPAMAAHAQRFRDFGWTGWAAFLLFIPVLGIAVWLVLLFYPGTRGPNRYGPDPLVSLAEAA